MATAVVTGLLITVAGLHFTLAQLTTTTTTTTTTVTTITTTTTTTEAPVPNVKVYKFEVPRRAKILMK